MTAFIILLFFCLACVAGGCVLRRAGRQAAEDGNARYYTAEGYHLYYDRKILRRLYGQQVAANETSDDETGASRPTH